MPQSLAQIYLHLVFSTKNRKPFLKDPALQAKMHAYLAGVCNNLDASAIQVGGVADHVHILCHMSRGLTVSDFLRELKRESSKWVKLQARDLAGFAWQAGFGVFSVSPSHVDPLTRYIVNQEEHHRKESFQVEFRRLLKKYKLPYDERYVWD